MSFSVVAYRRSARMFDVAVYFDGSAVCGRVGPMSRADADDLRRRVLSAGDDGVLVGLYIDDFSAALNQRR